MAIRYCRSWSKDVSGCGPVMGLPTGTVVDWVLYCGNGVVWWLVLLVFFVCCTLVDGLVRGVHIAWRHIARCEHLTLDH